MKEPLIEVLCVHTLYIAHEATIKHGPPSRSSSLMNPIRIDNEHSSPFGRFSRSDASIDSTISTNTTITNSNRV